MQECVLDFKSNFKANEIQTGKNFLVYDRPMKWHQRLQQRMDELGWNKAELSRRSGLPYDSINKYLRGDIEQPRGDALPKLAQTIKRPLIWLRDGIESDALPELSVAPGGLIEVPIVGKSEAGSFREVDEFDQSEPGFISLPRDRRFPNARQIAFEVEGDSMNALKPRPILPGDMAVCVSYEDVASEATLRDGMTVIVERTRDGGHTREWSIKQVEIYEDRVEFHPRSTNSKHKPIIISRDTEADEGTKVEIIGLV
ncbi:MAG: LexA family protein, partial [Phyllobacterium sp.]